MKISSIIAITSILTVFDIGMLKKFEHTSTAYIFAGLTLTALTLTIYSCVETLKNENNNN